MKSSACSQRTLFFQSIFALGTKIPNITPELRRTNGFMHNSCPPSVTHADTVGQSQYSFMVSLDIYSKFFSAQYLDCCYQVSGARTCDITNLRVLY